MFRKHFSAIIYGKPFPMGRPRMSPHTSKVFTDPKEKAAMRDFVWCLKQEFRTQKLEPIPKGVPIFIKCKFVHERPKKYKGNEELRKITVPDADNLLKFIWDGLQKARIIHNDNQITDCHFMDRIAAPNVEPHTIIGLGYWDSLEIINADGSPAVPKQSK
tara:strand:+ start:245 stop:724 length:480 start_codon:yes stop_codon:yes gene_type:complete